MHQIKRGLFINHKNFFIFIPALLILLTSCTSKTEDSTMKNARSEQQSSISESINTTENITSDQSSIKEQSSSIMESSRPSEPSEIELPKEDDIKDESISSDSYNGEYTAILKVGVSENLLISNYTNEGFDFEFVESKISGYASFTDDMSIAFYTDENEQSINFTFSESNVIVGAGYKYDSLAAEYSLINAD